MLGQSFSALFLFPSSISILQHLLLNAALSKGRQVVCFAKYSTSSASLDEICPPDCYCEFTVDTYWCGLRTFAVEFAHLHCGRLSASICAFKFIGINSFRNSIHFAYPIKRSAVQPLPLNVDRLGGKFDRKFRCEHT